MSDSSEFKRVTDALSRSEERFRTLVETMPAAVFLYCDNKTIYVNHAAECIGGYTRDELLELDTFWEIVHPDSRPRMIEVYDAHMRGATIPTAHEVKILTKGGESRWVQFTFGWVKTGPERGVLLGTAVDITERKVAQACLLAFARAVPDVSFILDEDGLYVEILGRPEKSDLLYAQSAELKGKRLQDVLPRESADAFLATIRETIQTQEPQVLEYELDVTAGRRCFEGRTAPLPLEGQKRMVVWLALDITARKSAEQGLVEAREELDRKAERSVSQGNDHGLTFRELTVLQLVVAGKSSDKEIGETLGISPLTANKHVGNILRKMKVGSRTSASVIALRDGLVS